MKKYASPFLKWAGGKGQLIPQIEQYFPVELAKGEITRYLEPFIGGGAIFFHIAQTYSIQELFILDINPELIIAYTTIQKDVESLIECLEQVQKDYLSLDAIQRKRYFYHIRETFNQSRHLINIEQYKPTWIERATQFIFLNRTCFNGLFRVNSKGEFNVPCGRYKNPRICDAENLYMLTEILQKTQILYGDFTHCREFVNSQSFVYFDPPYKPLNSTSNFTAYSQNSFDDSEQLRLRDFFVELDKQGGKLMLSNSDPQNEDVTNTFFPDAYAGYKIENIQAARNINSKASQRGKINEILIMNY